jgi:uncharacterized protein with NAD-binding domain and iron-sulfur cluster
MDDQARHVLVLGGGVAGLTAAHELAERGFRVTVIERHHIPGGKARSMPADRVGLGGPPFPPGEHGFRFFPSFYRHLPDTMRRIPFPGNARGVFDNLVPARRAEIARDAGPALQIPLSMPRNLGDVRLVLKDIFRNRLDIPKRDWIHFVALLVRLLGSCDARRYVRYENESWWSFSGAERRSPQYREYLADGLTRTLVAAKAREMSARTGGYILLQLLRLAGPDESVDRVLDGPTNDRWIDPWVSYLTDPARGVDYRTGTHVRGIVTDGTRVTKVVVQAGKDAPAETIDVDLVVSAMPVERLLDLLTPELIAAEPAFTRLSRLRTRWMNGVVFYLARDVPIVRGHVIYMDSPWALTSISQPQFWKAIDVGAYGDGRIRGILSVDVSDWNAVAPRLGVPAAECDYATIVDEVWQQIIDHLDAGGRQVLQASDRLGAFVDTDIHDTQAGIHDTESDADRQAGQPYADDVNKEPLLVNTAGSWSDRPASTTALVNFFLAGDFVRTYTDLATMEGANESARRAVNALLDHVGSSQERCAVWPLHEPVAFKPVKALDGLWFRLRHGRQPAVGPGPGR